MKRRSIFKLPLAIPFIGGAEAKDVEVKPKIKPVAEKKADGYRWGFEWIVLSVHLYCHQYSGAPEYVEIVLLSDAGHKALLYTEKKIDHSALTVNEAPPQWVVSDLRFPHKHFDRVEIKYPPPPSPWVGEIY